MSVTFPEKMRALLDLFFYTPSGMICSIENLDIEEYQEKGWKRARTGGVKAGKQVHVRRGHGWGRERGKEGTQQVREGSKQEGETRGEGEVMRVETQTCTIQPLWMGRTHAA